MTTDSSAQAAHPSDLQRKYSRRAVLLGSGTAAASVGAGALTLHALRNGASSESSVTAGDLQTVEPFTGAVLPCHGINQAGITTPHTAYSRAHAFKLHEDVTGRDLKRMCAVLTADIEALTAGNAPLADSEPQLAAEPARLTVTVGFGAELVRCVAADQVPAWLKPLPAFKHDQLDPQFNDGDLLLLIAADDLVTVSHAARMLLRSLRSFATPLWVQDGFRRARGTAESSKTMRNLMGQVDGTVNPDPAAADFADLVWLPANAGWLANGTCQVFRRIRMELDAWEQVDRPGREASVGRNLQDGGPLSGGTEFTPADFDAKNELGLPVIHAGAHIRRAHSTDASERIYRRSLNYDTGVEQGLLFICYQQDPYRQFVSIQQRLDEFDMLNEWITHTGSALFAIPPGWQPGGMLGETLFAAAGI